jgi:hypothetical protein
MLLLRNGGKMRTLVRCLLFITLCFVVGIMAVDNTKLARRQSISSFNSTPAPLSMLLVGGGLVVFGGILRRWLRT